MNNIVREDIENIINMKLEWGKLKGKNVLVTGATGYLAHYMILTMLMRNEMFDNQIGVIALCRSREKAKALYKDKFNRDDITFLFQDVTEDINYPEKIDFFIHMASPANPNAFTVSPWDVVSANINGFGKVLERAKKDMSERIMLFSSNAVYGMWSLENPPKETDDCVVQLDNSRDIYAISKLVCETMAKEEQEYLDIVIVRPSVIYGPGAVASQKKHFTDFVMNCINREPIRLLSEGKVYRNILYILDAVAGFFYVLLKGGGRYLQCCC